MAATATGNRAMVAETHSAGNGRVLRYALLPSHELTAAGGLGSLDVRWLEGIRRTRYGSAGFWVRWSKSRLTALCAQGIGVGQLNVW